MLSGTTECNQHNSEHGKFFKKNDLVYSTNKGQINKRLEGRECERQGGICKSYKHSY